MARQSTLMAALATLLALPAALALCNDPGLVNFGTGVTTLFTSTSGERGSVAAVAHGIARRGGTELQGLPCPVGPLSWLSRTRNRVQASGWMRRTPSRWAGDGLGDPSRSRGSWRWSCRRRGLGGRCAATDSQPLPAGTCGPGSPRYLSNPKAPPAGCIGGRCEAGGPPTRRSLKAAVHRPPAAARPPLNPPPDQAVSIQIHNATPPAPHPSLPAPQLDAQCTLSGTGASSSSDRWRAQLIYCGTEPCKDTNLPDLGQASSSCLPAGQLLACRRCP